MGLIRSGGPASFISPVTRAHFEDVVGTPRPLLESAVAVIAAIGASPSTREDQRMAKLFIAKVVTSSGPGPLVTLRAAGEGEAKLFLDARYPEDVIEAVVEPADWVSDRAWAPQECAAGATAPH